MFNSITNNDEVVLQRLTTASATIPCPQCNVLGSLTAVASSPSSRGFAACTDPNCNSQTEIDQLLPLLQGSQQPQSELQELKATVQFLLKKYEGLESLMTRLQHAETKVASLSAENAALKEQLRNSQNKLPNAN